jgi:hypothetical protein
MQQRAKHVVLQFFNLTNSILKLGEDFTCFFSKTPEPIARLFCQYF